MLLGAASVLISGGNNETDEPEMGLPDVDFWVSPTNLESLSRLCAGL